MLLGNGLNEGAGTNITMMIHSLGCPHARPSNPHWRRIISIEAALAEYELAFVGKCCLLGRGPHLDR